MAYNIGDIVQMKKTHPCGSKSHQWEVLRVGMDFRIRCLNCGRQVMLPRAAFEKNVKHIVSSASAAAAQQPGAQ